MAFNISEFKSQMDWFGGPMRGSLFEVQIFNYPGVTTRANSRDLSFFCKNATIPGMVFNTVQYENVGQMRKVMPVAWNPEPVQAIFMLDSDHQVMSFFHSWAQHIVNFSTQAGSFSEVDGKLPFEVGYKDEYAATVVIRHYSTNYQTSGQFYEVVLRNAFPIQMGDVDLAWENNDQFAVLPVSFQYDEIQFSGEKIGSPSARFGRGNGLIGLINQVGAIGQFLGFGGVPQGIQDAVNTYTRLDTFGQRVRNQLNQILR